MAPTYCHNQLGEEVPEWGDGRLRKTQAQFKEKRGPGGALSSDGRDNEPWTWTPGHGLRVYFTGVG